MRLSNALQCQRLRYHRKCGSTDVVVGWYTGLQKWYIKIFISVTYVYICIDINIYIYMRGYVRLTQSKKKVHEPCWIVRALEPECPSQAEQLHPHSPAGQTATEKNAKKRQTWSKWMLHPYHIETRFHHAGDRPAWTNKAPKIFDFQTLSKWMLHTYRMEPHFQHARGRTT